MGESTAANLLHSVENESGRHIGFIVLTSSFALLLVALTFLSILSSSCSPFQLFRLRQFNLDIFCLAVRCHSLECNIVSVVSLRV
jgi:hypothetical protein